MKFTQTAAIAAFIACASAEDAKPAATPAATCTVGKVEAFTDKECTKAAGDDLKKKVEAVEKTFKDGAAAFKATCVDSGDGKVFKAATCNADGHGTLYFSDKDCKTAVAEPTEDQKKAFTAWGGCFTTADSGIFLKITDATFLKAGAVAAVAIAASLY